MTPTAELDLAGQIGIALLVVPGVLNLPEQQRRIVNAEIYAVSIAFLGITGPRSRLISIKNATQDGQLIREIDEQPGAHSSQRRRWSPTREIQGRDGRPSHGRIGEDVGIPRVEEINVGWELGELQRDFIYAQMILEHVLVQFCRYILSVSDAGNDV